MDSRTPIPLGEYIFYGFAILIGLAWFVDFITQLLIKGTPDPVLTGIVGTVMAGLLTAPRAFRRGRSDDDPD